jgi:putative transposase
MVMNEKKLHRIYREEGLSVRRRRGRKRARGSHTPMPVPRHPNQRPNQRWSLDFLSDTFGACAARSLAIVLEPTAHNGSPWRSMTIAAAKIWR